MACNKLKNCYGAKNTHLHYLASRSIYFLKDGRLAIGYFWACSTIYFLIVVLRGKIKGSSRKT
jgi:hypothetical protein